ncbi:MAG: alpha-2-macroglobulin family protein, partial [Hyphomicrobiaceae bacterium]
MFTASRLIGLCASIAFASLPASADEKPFNHDGLSRDAARYQTWLAKNNDVAGVSATRERTTGYRELRKNGAPRRASAHFSRAVVAHPKDAQSWIGLAMALLAIPKSELKRDERYTVAVNASGAAYLAYKRSQTHTQKGEALAILAKALARRSYWRPALDAYKKSLVHRDDAVVRQAYDQLRRERGFRIINYRVEKETAAPRLCLEFSETLKKGDVDYSPFISVDGRAPQAVSAEGSQLCIDGMKHGKRFDIKARAGLPADGNAELEKNAQLSVYVRDRAPSVRFSGRNYVLPSRGQAGLPIVTINSANVGIRIYRVGDRSLVSTVANGLMRRQLSRWEMTDLARNTGQKIYEGTLQVRYERNKEVTSAIEIDQVISRMMPGVYAAAAWPMDVKNATAALATQWFVVSDIGLTAMTGEDGVHVFVRSLATGAVWNNVTIRLLARNNEILGQTTTDALGYAHFSPGLINGEGGLVASLLVAESDDNAYGFLDMATGAFDLTDRGVKGRAPPGPIDGYIYTERGVYRSGETVNLTTLIRDKRVHASSVPVTMSIIRPDGVEHQRTSLPDQGLGGRTMALLLPKAAMTGTWRAHVHTDPNAVPIAKTAFLVEDFVPERLAIKLTTTSKEFVPGRSSDVSVQGEFNYGPPASSLRLEGDVVVRPAQADLPDFPGYSFGLADQQIDAQRHAIANPGLTDANGQARLAVTLPPIPRTSRPLVADVIVRMREPGGRSVERTLRLPIKNVGPRIGIKPLFKGAQLREGEIAKFDIITLDENNTRTERNEILWELVRLDRRWQWYKRDGSWAYEPVTIARKVANGEIKTRLDGPARIAHSLEWGRYRLDVRARGQVGSAANISFDAGWYAHDALESPEMLAVALDKQSYRAGDIAKIKISSKQGGYAQISVLSGGLQMTKNIAIKAGDDEVAFDVGSDWGPGAYVVAALYRPMDHEARRMPQRSIGVAWLRIQTSERVLDVSLDVPDKVRSGIDLSVPVRVRGLSPGEKAMVTIAAVDVGILNITRFKTPAPQDWFFAQRQLGISYRDIYGRLIDGMRAERGTLKVGGDSGGIAMHASPPREQIVSMFSGLVPIDADGRTKVTFPVPKFNGKIRLMAVAWSREQVGQGTRDITVRDSIAITASAPRFLVVGDRARVRLDLQNIDGPPGDYRISVLRKSNSEESATSTFDSTEIITTELKLQHGVRRSQVFDIHPQKLGLMAYEIRVAGPNGEIVSRELLLDVKPPARNIRRVATSSLLPGRGQLRITNDVLTDLVPSRSSVSVTVGPLAQISVPTLLHELELYPYACAEQTTSRALPLLYASTLVPHTKDKKHGAPRGQIDAAIAHLLTMQDGAGGFGIWGPGNTDMWLTAYVTDFLGRARSAQHDVDARRFSQALDRLQNFINYASDFNHGGESRAYALYVLARNGRVPIGELQYYADTRLDRFATPLAKAQLGAALAMLGDKPRALRAFRAGLADLSDTTHGGIRRDYGSSLRDGAAIVTLASEVRMLGDDTAQLSSLIRQAFAKQTHTSTQEKAWLLLAAHALSERANDVELEINGRSHKGILRRSLSTSDLDDGAVTITNRGGEAVDAVVSVTGVSLTAEPA